MALWTTDLEIANAALANLGHTVQIGVLATDSTTEAKNARLFLDPEREVCLSEYDWNWARKRAVLIEVTGTGDWWNSVDDDWDHVYTLPTDCVEPRFLYPGIRNPSPQDAEPFEKIRNAADDGFVLACDVAAVTTGDKAPVLFYTARDVTVSHYPIPFATFLAWALAVHLAMPVIGGSDGEARKKFAIAMRRVALADAVRFDWQSRVRDQPPPTPSLAARGVMARKVRR